MAGTLYVIGTPIGNLSDLTYRAEEILSSINLIVAEDTRVSRKLLNHYNIDFSSMVSYHDKNEKYQAGKLIGRLLLGENIGNVISIENFGAGDLIETNYKNKNIYIPLNYENIVSVDLEKKTITINPMKGILD